MRVSSGVYNHSVEVAIAICDWGGIMKAMKGLIYVVIAILVFQVLSHASCSPSGSATRTTRPKSTTQSKTEEVSTKSVERLIREHDEDVLIAVTGGANEQYKNKVQEAKRRLDGSNLTRNEVDEMYQSLERSRDAALEETANYLALPEIQGTWHGVRREKHTFEESHVYNAPNGSGSNEYGNTIGIDEYAGDLEVQGTTIINNGPEYHWFEQEQDTVYGARHEIDKLLLRRSTDIVDQKMFYASEEPHEFQGDTKYNTYEYRTQITATDQIAEKYYPITQSTWYLLHGNQGDRLVWMRVFKDAGNRNSSYQKTEYSRQNYTIVKYVWTR